MMNEPWKSLSTIAVSAIVSYFLGRLHSWHAYKNDRKRKREEDLEHFEKDYINRRLQDPNFDAEPRRRMKAFQELGAYKYNFSELEKLRKSIIARGFADPLLAHDESLIELENYPYSVFLWAEKNRVNLESIVSVLEKWIEQNESSDIVEGSELDQKLLNWRVTLEIWKRNEEGKFSTH